MQSICILLLLLQPDAQHRAGTPVGPVPPALKQSITVSGGRVFAPLEAERLAGSYALVDAETLTSSRVFTFEEALRKVAGVHARQEEGFGMRPNIGIRGLNPTRSSKVLLLEDGQPLSYAPYGDNASYYHPPVDRFQEIEVVKGAGQILYGPMTVGGVINYVTPSVPDKRGGWLGLSGGNRDYLNAHLQYGFNLGKAGFLVDGLRKQGQGARENNRHGISDLNVKMLSRLSANQTLGLRFNHFAEGSVVTYSGLREAEWLVNPRGNPFRNDRFDTNRYAASVQHTWAATPQLLLNSSGYSSIFLRDWWRQSSSSAQRPNDAADPLCGGMANLLTTCGNEGRLRAYYTWGLEQRARWSPAFGGRRHEIDFGIRYHDELQERVQKNGPLPLSRDGVLVENNRRVARAFSGFLQDRLTFGRLTATLGARVERIHYNRTNRLGLGGAGVFGETSLLEVIPGVGLSYSFSEKLTIFSGVHRGFAPPRVEDLISNTTGLAVDLNAERSWSYESGVRSRLGKETMLEATWFHSDFSNQIVPSSVAGGLGAVLTNGGRTIHSGLEFSGRWMRRALGGSKHGAGLSGSYTMLPTAEFAGQRRSSVAGFTNVSVTGNRLPYAPRSLANATVHYAHQNGVNAQLEAVYTGRQFGDDLNTVGGTPDGQRGRIPSALVWNATVNVPVESWGTTFFVTAKNLTDRLYIADRTRGLLPGMPRLIQAGFRFAF